MKRVLFILFMLLLLMVFPAAAGGPPWSAWLYDAQNGRAVLVGSDGVVISDLPLPVAQGFDRFPERLAVSPSGTLLAFVIMSSDTQERQLRVFDTASQNVRVAYNLPILTAHSLDYRADEALFSEGEAALAFGYALDDGTWQVITLDTRTGEAVAVLRSDDPAAQQWAAGTETPLVPVVQRFRNDLVTFALAALPGESQPLTVRSYNWSPSARTVTPDPIYSGLEHSTFEPTNEVLLPAFNPDLPGSDTAAEEQANVIDVVLNYQRWPFYADPEAGLIGAAFVQNGERILVSRRDSETSYTYTLVERDGTEVSRFTAAAPVSVRGLTDGYIGAVVDPGTGATMLFYTNTREQAAQAIVWTDSTGTPLQLVWAQDRRLAPYGPYQDWAELAEPIYIGLE